MFNGMASAWFHILSNPPAFRIHARARQEQDWREVAVFATRRRDLDSPWPPPLFRGTCITWCAGVIAVGWDFAERVLLEQKVAPASRELPVEVSGGRIRQPGRPAVWASEILAHECGHTWQAQRLSWLYLPMGLMFTLFREGPHWWNRFENQASTEGLFGGIVNGSVHPRLQPLLG